MPPKARFLKLPEDLFRIWKCLLVIRELKGKLKEQVTMMKKLMFASCVIFLCSCSPENDISEQIIPVPNGDFELWDNLLFLESWQTNSCPPCDPPYESYIIRRDSTAYQGLFAAHFIYNDVFASLAVNDFSIPAHPSYLTGYVKSKLPPSDSILIGVHLFNNGIPVDSGKIYITSSISNYTQIEIPISQSTLESDSATITIKGGTKTGSELWIDHLQFIKN